MFNKGWNDYIPMNDSFFNIYTSNKNISKYRDVIKRIDGVDYIGDGKILTKYNIKGAAIPVTTLSTGAKTFLNVALNKNKIFLLNECGENALSEILKLEDGQGYLTCYLPFTASNISVEVIIKNQRIIFTDGSELNNFLYDILEGEC